MALPCDIDHLAERALNALNDLRLPATPRNFEVWYAHLDGRNPALSRDIQRCLEGGAVITALVICFVFGPRVSLGGFFSVTALMPSGAAGVWP